MSACLRLTCLRAAERSTCAAELVFRTATDVTGAETVILGPQNINFILRLPFRMEEFWQEKGRNGIFLEDCDSFFESLGETKAFTTHLL